MAVLETEKETWSDESLSDSPQDSGSLGNDEKSTETPSRLLNASSTAIRSLHRGLGRVSSASVRLYRHSWPKVSSASVRLYDRGWPKVRSKTIQIYQHVSPKLSSASVRLYQRTWPTGSSTMCRLSQHGLSETFPMKVRSPHRDRLEITSMMLRLFQVIAALYVFISVTESFRSKITYDGRVRQIRPMMLITLIYASLAIVCFLLLNLAKKLRASTWHMVALFSVPGDMSMTCLFIAKDVIFGVHSFECAAASGTVSAINHYATLQDLDSLELRSFLDDRASHGLFIGSTRDACLLSSSVYVVCVLAALSYIGSVTITVRQVLNSRKSISVMGGGQYPGHVEQAILPNMPSAPQMIHRGPLTFESNPTRAELREPFSTAGPSISSASILPSSIPSPQDPKYANMPAGIVESMAVAPPRTSQETTSSMDPDQYIVSDGFRPRGRPPSYTSSRESSPGPPEYRSRPPSLHTIVLVGP